MTPTTKNSLAQKYLKEHGINDETIETYELTWDNNYLHIPIKDDEGNDLFIKSRYLAYGPDSKEPKYKNSKGSHAALFNFYAVKDSDTIIIAEGEMDTIKLMQEGFPAISSTGGAGTFPEEFAKQLKDKKIFLAYDNDPAGQNALHTLLDLLPEARVITLPENVKDICEYFAEGHTTKEFIKLMKLAQSKIEWTASHIPEDHKLVSAKELQTREFPEIPWLIESILYDEGFCFIYGAEGIGKSFLTLSIAKAVASGEKWLDVFEVPNTANVLFLDKENPLSLTAKRIKNLGGFPDNVYWLEYPQKFSLHNNKGGASEFAIDVATQIKEKNIGLVIVDSLIDLIVGSESSAEETQRFFDALRTLYPKVSFLVLHHENKPAQGVMRNSAQRLRGSSNINAQTFTMFRLEAIAKSKTDMTLEQTKTRDEMRLDKFMLRRDVSYTEDRKPIVTGMTFLGFVQNEDFNDSKEAEAENAIITLLASYLTGVSRKDLIESISAGGISSRTIDKALRNMEDENSIRKFKKGRDVWFVLDDPIVNDNVPEGGML